MNLTSVFLPCGVVGSETEEPVRSTFRLIQRALPTSVLRLKRSKGTWSCPLNTCCPAIRGTRSVAPKVTLLLTSSMRPLLGLVTVEKMMNETSSGILRVKLPVVAIPRPAYLPTTASSEML